MWWGKLCIEVSSIKVFIAVVKLSANPIILPIFKEKSL